MDATLPGRLVNPDTHYAIDTDAYRGRVQRLCNRATTRFRGMLYRSLAFHLCFGVAFLSELALLIAWLPTFLESSRLGLCLAALFMTAFSYVALRLYFQARRPEQLVKTRNRYLSHCRQLLLYQEGIAEHHLALGNAAMKLANRLDGEEHRLYAPPKWLKALAPPMEKWGCWLHWRDVLSLRELLLKSAIEEHIKLIKCEPTNLEAHAALANVYVLLSSVYLNPSEGTRWAPAGRSCEELERQSRKTAQRAIEEFKILNAYAPNDPWVHAQLAYSYRDLQMPKEEIREYEMIMKLKPNDLNTLFQLGMRYFQSGRTAKGLQVYEELKRRRYRQADELIAFYR